MQYRLHVWEEKKETYHATRLDFIPIERVDVTTSKMWVYTPQDAVNGRKFSFFFFFLLLLLLQVEQPGGNH